MEPSGGIQLNEVITECSLCMRLIVFASKNRFLRNSDQKTAADIDILDEYIDGVIFELLLS